MSTSLAARPQSAPRLPPAAAPGRDGPSPWLGAVMLAAVYCVPVLAAVRPVTDWDIWWHLRVGQWVVDNGQVTTSDPFSAYGAGRPWVAYSWLFEVSAFGLHQALGLTGVLLYRVLLSVAVVAALHRLVARREPRYLVATALTAAAALAVTPLLSERPWLFTIVFTALTLDVILDLREGRRSITFWLLPLAYVLWANLHIQFVYGFLLLGLGCAAPAIDRVLRRPSAGHATTVGTRAWWRLVALAATCALATLVNPYGVALYGVVLEYATQPFPFRVVNELMALDFREGWDWVILGLTLVTACALARRTSLSSFEVLLFVGSVVLGFRARRDVWMIVLAALVILPAAVPAIPALGARLVLGRLRFAVVLLVAAAALAAGAAKGLGAARLREEEAKVFPARAVAAIAERGYDGPLFNHFNWGGYLIWRLPRLPVSMDGRTNLHGEARLQRSWATWAGLKGWDEDPELAAARLVLADAGCSLASLLRKDPRFELAHEDDQAAVFVRRE